MYRTGVRYTEFGSSRTGGRSATSRIRAQLREIHQVPPVLFSRGTLHPGEPAVSVVGSRRACDQSLDWASEVSAALGSAGI
ncbi:MAG: DNA-processing protein DprA, partial [Pseudonocardiaceae bacterium]